MSDLQRNIYLIGGPFHGEVRQHPCRENCFRAYYTDWDDKSQTAFGMAITYVEVVPKSGTFCYSA